MEMKKVLMVHPEHFDVVYAINAHMTSEDGSLKKVNRSLAQVQWNDLKETYSKLGFSVKTLPGVPNLPDMVFTANQSLPFWQKNKNRPGVILSHMRSEFRRPEVTYFETYYQQQGYDIYNLKSSLSLEGNGDALQQGETLWAGYGFRTDLSVYEEVRQITGYEIVPLELRNEYFYHLDTCFSILNQDTVAIVNEAFQPEGLAQIKARFQTVIQIDLAEAKDNFAGNCHSPDGKHVLLQKGSAKFCADLLKYGFTPIELDTSEYMKSGGSVFCMKMMHY